MATWCSLLILYLLCLLSVKIYYHLKSNLKKWSSTLQFSIILSFFVFQVGDKTDWDLGVARESINRKGAITVRPDNGYWAICRRNGGSLYACAGPAVTLHLKEIPQKVGIFLDYEEGSVSFYNTEAKTHIYTYSGLTFTEPLYPYFNPCIHDNGKNMVQLVICPIEAGITVDTSARWARDSEDPF